MKKLLFIFAILAGACIRAGAQDIITMKDGSEIEAQVLEINLNDVRYKKYSNLDGPVYTESKRNIQTIQYNNGEIDSFTQFQSRNAWFPLQREIPDGIAAGMQFREYVDKYRLSQYSRLEPEYYSPFTMSLASYVIPGLGQCLCGETVRGICIGAATMGSLACAAGFGDFSDETGAILGIAAFGLWIWNIYDANRVAKIKNMYINDTQSRHKASVSVGPMSLKINF